MENNIISEKKRNIYSSVFSNDYSLKFFFKSILHHVISLEIYENNKSQGISFELICSNIPKSIGSRSSIQSILNDALSKDIFLKQKSQDDKRIKNYFLTDKYSDIINSWIDSEKIQYTKLNGD
tara:strand:+ start:552 stop:920 length:369 start_codon:yes stop_codon:yes gene_type:complete